MEPAAFETQRGDPVPAVTAAEMREVDRVAVDGFGIEVLQMMEHAGRALASAVRERADTVTVLAGNGGNGGGGLCCARHLRNRGIDVRVVLDRPPEELSGPAGHHLATLVEMGIPVGVGPDAVPHSTTFLVDALLGYGLSGPLRGTAADIVRVLKDSPGAVVSLDVPSGLDSTSGERPGVAVDPESVVTLALPKTGLRDSDADILLADIGLPAGVYGRLDIPVFEFERYTVAVSAR